MCRGYTEEIEQEPTTKETLSLLQTQRKGMNCAQKTKAMEKNRPNFICLNYLKRIDGKQQQQQQILYNANVVTICFINEYSFLYSQREKKV